MAYGCSGKHYGCIVRKKVVLLEELKRDTPEFGGFSRALTAWGICCVCVCIAVFFMFSGLGLL